MSFLCIPVAFSKHRLHSLAHKAYDDQIHGHSWSLISTSYEHPHLNQTNLSICIIHLPTRMHFALSYFQDIASFFFFLTAFPSSSMWIMLVTLPSEENPSPEVTTTPSNHWALCSSVTYLCGSVLICTTALFSTQSPASFTTWLWASCGHCLGIDHVAES